MPSDEREKKGARNEDLSASSFGPLGEPFVNDYLKVLRASLVTSLAPEIASDRGRAIIEMAATLLDHLIVRTGEGVGLAQQRDAAHARAGEALSRQLDKPAATTEDLMAAAIVSGAKHDASTANIQQTILAALETEHNFLENLAALERAAETENVRKAAKSLNAEDISAYLSDRYGGEARVTEFGAPMGGFSKDVLILKLSGAARPADAVVIRRDLADGPLEGSVANEFQVLRAVQQAGVPVAEPLWLETNPAPFGSPALCLRFVKGAPITGLRGEIPAHKAEGSLRALARILAGIHSIDAKAAGLRPAEGHDDAQPYVLALVDQFEEQWRRRRGAENVVLASAFSWMRAHLPKEKISARIVHGDASLRNLMFDGDTPSALLDWETWHLGDPAEDLAYLKDEVEGFMNWGEFVAEYRAAGGEAISDDRFRYWSMWRELRGTVTSLSMMNSVTSGNADLKAVFGGLYYARILLSKLAERLQVLLRTQ